MQLNFNTAEGEVGGEARITLLTCEQQDLGALFAHFFDQLENTEIACVIKTGKAFVKDHRRHFSVEEKLDERKSQAEICILLVIFSDLKKNQHFAASIFDWHASTLNSYKVTCQYII